MPGTDNAKVVTLKAVSLTAAPGGLWVGQKEGRKGREGGRARRNEKGGRERGGRVGLWG